MGFLGSFGMPSFFFLLVLISLLSCCYKCTCFRTLLVRLGLASSCIFRDARDGAPPMPSSLRDRESISLSHSLASAGDVQNAGIPIEAEKGIALRGRGEKEGTD